MFSDLIMVIHNPIFLFILTVIENSHHLTLAKMMSIHHDLN